jgi:cell division protein FtsW
LVACLTAASIDYHVLKNYAWVFYLLAVVMLILVLVPHIGARVNGARRWFKIPHTGVRFEPSEFAKLALILAVAWYGDRCQRQMVTWKRGIVIPGVFIGAVLALVFVEPDRGTTILLASVMAVMLLIAGVRWRCLAPLVVSAIAGLAYSLLHDPMRSKRIFAWLYMEQNKDGVGYQSKQAMLALGAGGWSGLGLGNSRQKLGFLPEHNTDFIFSIIGEELGLIATLLVIVGFLLILAAGCYISSKAQDPFGLLLGSGVTFLISLQAFINIGVVTSALPNKGLPLPFISYGGSNLLMMLTGVGLLLSVARRARSAMPATGLEPEMAGIPAPQLS